MNQPKTRTSPPFAAMMFRLQRFRLPSGRCLATTCLLVLLLCNLVNAEPPTAEQLEFFEAKVRPILVEHCYECHSNGAEEIEAGLLLDSKQGWQTGGDSGPAIVPGNLEDSLLIDAVRYEESIVSGMPPRSKLPASHIKTLERWVEMGAPDPRSAVTPKPDTAKAEPFNLEQRFNDHWSWKPIGDPQPPAVKNEEWVLQNLDRFILAKLEQAGLKPAKPADRSRWLRRVYFDLIGLPPSPEQINQFVTDQSPEAYQRVVEQLLGSRQFGEKWARHWLDLVRYAETYGHEFDYAIPHPIEYRDYVIRALNADVPYDQFVKEHIAGDLLPQPRRNPEQQFNESIIGTGFWYLHEATHSPTDVLENEAIIIDNQLDVFGKTFLGLTIACARCHDHKFDAISTADYYALSAYIQSSCRQLTNLDANGVRETAARDINQQRRAAAERLSADWKTSSAAEKLVLEKLASLAVTGDVDPLEKVDPSAVFQTFDEEQLPSGWSTSGDAFQMTGSGLDLQPDGSISMPGTIDSGAAGNQQVGILRSPTFEISTRNIHLLMKATPNVAVQLVIDNYQMAPFNALLFRGTFLNGKSTDTKGQWEWKRLDGDLRKYLGHRAYLEFTDPGSGTLAIDAIVFSDDAPARTNAEPIGDGGLPSLVATALADITQGKSNRWFATQCNLHGLSIGNFDPKLIEQLVDARRTNDQLPAPRFALAMAQGTTENANVYIRGSHKNPGQPVPPRFLEALGSREGSRLDLANAVASAENPLTARVIVNRLWHHLLGRGLVPTVDDFGPQGQPASHPDLLDNLAQELIRSDWSLKHIISSIVLSQTYRQDSVTNPAIDAEMVARIDPTNQLLHRMPVRRLPSESIRDAIFATSGRLDLTSYGPSVPTHRTAFMTGRGARGSGPLDGNGRRSIYLAVYRNFLNPFMLAFDTPNPFGPKGRRSKSNVPAQALTLMNDPMVIDQAKTWAKEIIKDNEKESDSRKIIEDMVKKAHGTQASPDQITALENFLDQQTMIYGKRDERAWADLAHALFNMKAFYFLQ